MSIESTFTAFAADKLIQLEARVETCIDKLTPEQIWSRHSENENAVGNLALHLAGNVRQWILSGVGGEPDTRVRDREFAARGGVDSAELKRRLRSTVEAAATFIHSVSGERIVQRIAVQDYQITVLEAIFHVVEHFAMHTGQIIFATKLLTGEDLGFYAHLRTAKAHGEQTP